ncbi:MAG: hypothetical protein Q7I97_08830 [Thermovirgaceae bacterium]|nr:hypothetical protein [Thermovirgaceae bacterium]
MSITDHPVNRRRKGLRIAARALFACVFAFFMAMFIGEMLSEPGLSLSQIPADLGIVLGFFAVMFAGFALSFRSAYRGGQAILAGALACAVFMLVRGGVSDLDAAAVFGLPFAVPALILILNRP